MNKIDGIYKVDLLGQFGWESFSTAFIHEGQFRSASTEHYTAGTYEVDNDEFEMEGELTQHADNRSLFGRKTIRNLPIRFSGIIHDNQIDGEAKALDGSKLSLRLRLNRQQFLN